jgi:outer membrane lipoprotein-sorting protein
MFRSRHSCRAMGRVAALVLVALLAAAPSVARELDELLVRFDEVQSSIRTLSAEFTETTQSMLLKDEIVAKGKVYLTKPSAVRWEYSTPEEMRFVIADDTYTGYFPQRKQAEQRDIQRWGEQLFRFLGIGQTSEELARFYNIQIVEDGPGAEAGRLLLVLDPRKRRVRKRMESVRFWIDEQTLLPARIEYSTNSGSKRAVEFDRIDVNPELSASIYQVELPPDVEVTKGFSALSGLSNSASN